MIALKRAYQKPSRSDGTRVLVDRRWPRGVSKASASIDAWLKAVAPSDELRRWFHTHPTHWAAFRKRYLDELNAPEAAHALEQLHEMAESGRKLTLVFASSNLDYNNAVVLKELLDGMRKPPVSSGPGRAATTVRARRR